MTADLKPRGEWVKGVAHWREGDTAYLSVAFTWRLPEAKRVAEYYRAIGCRVIAGGPGVFTQRKFLADVAEIPSPSDPASRIPDAIARHNPMATRALRMVMMEQRFSAATGFADADIARALAAIGDVEGKASAHAIRTGQGRYRACVMLIIDGLKAMAGKAA